MPKITCYDQPMGFSLFKVWFRSKRLGSILHLADLYISAVHPKAIEHYGMDPIKLYKACNALIEELELASNNLELDEEEFNAVIYYLGLARDTLLLLSKYLTQYLSS